MVTSKRYCSDIDSWIFLATKARPDLCHTASMLGSHISIPRRLQTFGVKRILHYFRGSKHVRMHLGIGEMEPLNAYVDCTCGYEMGSRRRSRPAILIQFGSAPVCACSILQKAIAKSSIKDEYLALSESSKVIAWLPQVLTELNIVQATTTVL